jgi:hypothetical protein
MRPLPHKTDGAVFSMELNYNVVRKISRYDKIGWLHNAFKESFWLILTHCGHSGGTRSVQAIGKSARA